MSASARPPARTRSGRGRRSIAALALGGTAVVLLAGCGSSDVASGPSTTGTSVTEVPATAPVTTVERSSTTTTLPRPTGSTPGTTEATLPVGCTAADAADVETIDSSLIEEADRIGEASVVVAGDLTYLGANFYNTGGTRIENAGVWLRSGDAWYALNGSARGLSSFPDGRDLPGQPSADDESGLAVQDCANAAAPPR